MIVADLHDRIPRNGRNIDVRRGRNLAGDQNEPRRDRHLAGDPSVRVLFQYGVQNGIRNLVADFIRVSFRNGF
ncbi:hypothetical protein D3C71_1418680 [compost metagenome]